MKTLPDHRVFRSSLIQALFFFALAALASLTVPLMVAVLFGRVIPQAENGLLAPVAAALLAAGLMRSCLHLAGLRELLRRGVEAADQAGRASWAFVATLPLTVLQRAAAGEIAAEGEAAAEAARRRHEFLQAVLPAVCVAAANLGLMMVLDPLSGGAAGFLAAVVVGGAVAFRRGGRAALYRHFEETGRRAARMEEAFREFARIRLLGGEPGMLGRWEADSARLNRLAARIGKTGAGTQAVLAGTIALCSALAFICSSRTDLPVELFLAFFAAFGAYAASLRVIASAWPVRLDALTLEHHAARLRQSASARPKRTVEELSGRIAAENLDFRHASSSARILRHCSFEISSGEFVVISGASGSGKSTLLKILLGFAEPTAGEIRVDGLSFDELDLEGYRSRLGLVTQNMAMSPGSLWQNIAGSGRLSLDEAWSAAERAGLADEIRALPMQMHTLAGEGGRNFSCGQRQRFLLARALARHPDLLLLDEPAAGLDLRTTTAMWNVLRNLRMTRILFVRRALPSMADRYLSLEDGRLRPGSPAA